MCVGEITSSLTQARAGICARNKIARPMSSGCTMRSRVSLEGGTGRVYMMGVATSPGSSDVARMPWPQSSMLMDSLKASTARLVAL